MGGKREQDDPGRESRLLTRMSGSWESERRPPTVQSRLWKCDSSSKKGAWWTLVGEWELQQEATHTHKQWRGCFILILSLPPSGNLGGPDKLSAGTGYFMVEMLRDSLPAVYAKQKTLFSHFYARWRFDKWALSCHDSGRERIISKPHGLRG